MFRRVLHLFPLVIGAAPAAADVLQVDAAGGPHVFLDIPAALAVAAPGDTILVAAGTYGPFTVTNGVAVLGQSGTRVHGQIRVSGTAPGSVCILAELAARQVRVTGCAGTVLLDRLDVWEPSSLELRIEASDDVRLHRVGSYSSSGRLELVAIGSRVEAVASRFHGWPLAAYLDSSTVHFARTDAVGVDGWDDWECCLYFWDYCSAGDGGDAVDAVNTRTLVAGTSSNFIRGGRGGLAGDPQCDGWGGLSYQASGGERRSSSVHYDPAPHGPATTPNPADPTLELIGVPVPGRWVSLRVRGPAGGNARLYVGAEPLVQPTPGVYVERLTSEDEALALGVVPANGVIDHPYRVPRTFGPAACLWFQATVTLTGGELRRTNSTPVVARSYRIGERFCSTNSNSTGSRADLFAYGTRRIDDNNIHLSARNVPAGRPGYFLMSRLAGYVPYFGGGQGNLCLGQPLVRFRDDVLVASPENEVGFDLDLADLPQGTQVLPGETWRFQMWFRDANPGSTSNTTDALGIAFQ